MSEASGWLAIAEVIGREAAAELVRIYGGIELYIPKRLYVGHPLVDAIGLEAAKKLAHERGGSKIWPPVLKPVAKGDIARASGSLSAVARRFGVTRRYVCLVRRECSTAGSKED